MTKVTEVPEGVTVDLETYNKVLEIQEAEKLKAAADREDKSNNKEDKSARYQTLIAKNKSLEGQLTDALKLVQDRTGEAEKAKADLKAIDIDELTAKGEFKALYEGRGVENKALERDKAELILVNARLKQGLEAGLSLALAELVQGDDKNSIALHIEKLKPLDTVNQRNGGKPSAPFATSQHQTIGTNVPKVNRTNVIRKPF